MRILLDTHAFVWWIAGETDRISAGARRSIEAEASDVFFSVASAWELAVKFSLGRERMPADPAFIPTHLDRNRFTLLPIELRHAIRVGRLPQHHRDPFDRMLVAQALEEGCAIVTADPAFRRYRVKVIW